MLIDLRSDTVTKPSLAMRQAMAMAEVGDDVFDEDPSIIALQEAAAALLGKESALYCPTGCMTNQLAINVLTTEGDEVILEADSHIFNYETTAASILSRVQLNPVKAQKHGLLTVDDVRTAIREKAYYMPVSRVLAIENTHNRAGGTIYPIERIKELSALAREHDIHLHLDGARLWNACAATGLAPQEYAQYFDTVSICFSKGLGAPVGSAICASKALITKAHRMRKIWGGGMRQAGIIAAGALYALENNRDRIIEDNKKARRFAEIISSIASKVTIDLEAVQTNIVLLNLHDGNDDVSKHIDAIGKKGVRVSEGKKGMLRAIAHLDVTMEQCEEAAHIIANYFA